MVHTTACISVIHLVYTTSVYLRCALYSKCIMVFSTCLPLGEYKCCPMLYTHVYHSADVIYTPIVYMLHVQYYNNNENNDDNV